MPVSKKYIEEINLKAEKAINKPAIYGDDIDLTKFQK